METKNLLIMLMVILFNDQDKFEIRIGSHQKHTIAKSIDKSTNQSDNFFIVI
jgi:hypothetical protein